MLCCANVSGMYTTVLLLHSWIRWVALVACVGVTLAALRGKVDGEKSIADRWGLVAMLSLDLQMLLGLVLYLGLSPNMQEILNHFGESMKRADTRFWAVEHISAMFVAIVLAHVGRVLARKAATPAAKRTRLLVCFGAATLLLLVGMPWPGRPGGRDLFRL
jgi:heme A synthase